MKLEPLLSYYAELEAPHRGWDYALRDAHDRRGFSGGEITGDRIKGKFRNLAAADWLTMTEGFGHLDVRATIETHDGALHLRGVFRQAGTDRGRPSGT